MERSSAAISIADWNRVEARAYGVARGNSTCIAAREGGGALTRCIPYRRESRGSKAMQSIQETGMAAYTALMALGEKSKKSTRCTSETAIIPVKM